MELKERYRLRDEVRFMRPANYAIITHLGNGAWFKVVPWALETLQRLSDGPAAQYVAQVASTYGQSPQVVQEFLATLNASGMIEPATAPLAAASSPDISMVVWRANGVGPFAVGQSPERFIDTLVISRVKHLALVGQWVGREDFQDVLALASLVLNSVLLVCESDDLTPEVCARLDQLPPLVEITRAGSALPDACAAAQRLRERFSETLRLRLSPADLSNEGWRAQRAAVPPQVGLDITYLLPSDRDPLCLAAELGRTGASPQLALGWLREQMADQLAARDQVSMQWFYERNLKRTRSSCGAGTRCLAAEPDGCLYPCHGLMSAGDCVGRWRADESLTDALEDTATYRALRRRHVDAMRGCRDCDVRYFCGGGCPANARQAGTLEGPDPYCPLYRPLYRAAADVWRSDRPLEANFADLVNAL